MLRRLLPLLAACAALQTVYGRLSIPEDSPDYDGSPRETAISEMADQIANEPRTLTIDNVVYPFYDGPKSPPGSLASKIALEELETFKKFSSSTPGYLAGLIRDNAASLTSMDAITELYVKAQDKIEMPMAMDNSDETFGEQRVTVKAFRLRKADKKTLGATPLTLEDDDVREICGQSASELLKADCLFIEDFRDFAASFNDPKRKDKYVPNVVGYFCVTSDTGKLLPLEIQLPDTELAYSPLDSDDEWALAKMALEAASINFHTAYHGAETHAVTIPLRVEAYRTMAETHPVRALLLRHVFLDFALEMQAAIVLLNTSTALDLTFGWGATGTTRAVYALTQDKVSLKQRAFHADLTARGLDQMDGHKYAYYGAQYHDAIDTFVKTYVDAYYENDRAVTRDVELQEWATQCNENIRHVEDFPEAFTCKADVRRLLTHLIFTSTVRHHAINGAATWHGAVPPFSPAALWKPLPTKKLGENETLDLLPYTVPTKLLPAAMGLGAAIFRDVPESESILSAYKAEPFSSESVLKQAIRDFGSALQEIEDDMQEREADEMWPFLVLLPSRLPHYPWV